MAHIHATGFYMVGASVKGMLAGVCAPEVIKYGILYNRYAAFDPRNICSAGSHIPTIEEWKDFLLFLGGVDDPSGVVYLVDYQQLKTEGTTYWNVGDGTNTTLFNGRGAGARDYFDGGFLGLKRWEYLHVDGKSINNGNEYVTYLVIDEDSYNLALIFYGWAIFGSSEKVGASIRPVKDSTTLSDGQTGTYTGNDGKVYRTICINGKEWVADNICETQYRNGDAILEVTDNGEWMTLTTGAMCAYNNDWVYVYNNACVGRLTAKGNPTGTTNGVTSVTGLMRELHECCAVYGFEFATEPTDGLMFLTVDSMQIGSSVSGAMDDYVIEWRLGSRTGEIVFVTGEGTDPAIQAQHPFTDEVVFAGTLYPVIRYVWVDGVQYVSHWEDMDSDTLYAPDLITCLDPVVVVAVDCETVLGTDPLYQYVLTYNNLVDIGVDKSRKIKFNICGNESDPMQYLAWELMGYTVADQIKIYYCTLLDSEGTLIDNFIHGINIAPPYGPGLTHYPSGYPTNPRITGSQYSGTQPLAFVTDFSGITYTEGDYIRIEIIGSVYEPTNNNTNWSLKLQNIRPSDLNCNFPFDTGVNKITSTPVMAWNASTCQYEITYNTEDTNGGFYTRTAPQVADSFLWKYTGAFHNGYWYGPQGGTGFSTWANPITLYMRWNESGSGWYFFNHAYSCQNLTSGHWMTATKDTSAITFTFSHDTEYNILVADIAAMQADPDYITWQGLTDSDSRYYGYFMIRWDIGGSCGDAGITTRYFYLSLHCPISYDAINRTVTITFVIPTNNYVDTVCSTVYENINNTNSTLTSTKNSTLPVGETTYIGSPHYLTGAVWPRGTETHDTVRSFGYGISFQEMLINNLCNPADLGFCKQYDTATNKVWVLPRYNDRVTFLSTATHEARLTNWKLERTVSLRTDVCTDFATYELVYSTTSMVSTATGVAAVTGTLKPTMVGESTGVASVTGRLNIGYLAGVCEPAKEVRYGLLYNWYAVTDVRNICPEGWHMPSNTEFNTLITFGGGSSVAGLKFKEAGIVYWDEPNEGATNEYGFNGRGAASRNYVDGSWSSLKVSTRFWTSVSISESSALNCRLSYNLKSFSVLNENKATGRSLRPFKDSTTLTHGQTGTYTGNDGKTYRTICIGTQEWLADNLAETKFRNGENIPEVTDNTAWAALTTAGMCAYNNDWSYVDQYIQTVTGSLKPTFFSTSTGIATVTGTLTEG